MEHFRHQIDDDLALVPPLPVHAEALFAAIDRSRERVGQWLDWVAETKSVDDVRNFLRWACKSIGEANDTPLLIQYRGEIAGGIGLHDISHADESCEIGYWLADGFEGKGVMTRCVRAIDAHARAGLGFKRVQICCSTRNERSRAVMERLGYTHEATLAAGDPLPGGDVTDQYVYATVHEQAPPDARPVEFRLPTALPNVSLALQMPHHADTLYAKLDAERERLGQWLMFMGRTHAPDDTRGHIRRGWEEAGKAERIQTLVLRGDEIVGGLGAGGFGGVLRRGELGYWLANDAEGQGVMTAALRALDAYLWRAFPRLARLQIRTAEANTRSAALAERCGFNREGLLRRDHHTAGVWHDTLIYGKRRPEGT